MIHEKRCWSSVINNDYDASDWHGLQCYELTAYNELNRMIIREQNDFVGNEVGRSIHFSRRSGGIESSNVSRTERCFGRGG